MTAKLAEKQCESCGNSYQPRRSSQRFCSGVCRNRYNAAVRGTGTRHPAYKAARTKTSDGYIVITHPDGCRVVYEHRFVMEQVLDRELTQYESVHHRNGDRADNRPENLELWSRWQPAGQRVEDKVRWAVGLLAMYRPAILKEEACQLI